MRITSKLLQAALLFAILPQAGMAAVTEIKADERGHFITKDADDIGLRPGSLTYDTPVMTANGQINAARVTLRRVEIDGVRVRDVAGMVLPAGSMSGSLLGMSFL